MISHLFNIAAIGIGTALTVTGCTIAAVQEITRDYCNE